MLKLNQRKENLTAYIITVQNNFRNATDLLALNERMVRK
jgi:hypothetical protein